ncbi:MAG TPA: TolC family protein [Planctomycetaceae bacterium]|nr:TolC family protein [Planctomycetaceae bacterium]
MLARLLRRKTCRHATWLILAALGMTALSGCSRQFWRKQADVDSYGAITEKLNNPHWELPRIDLTADDRSRFYDPYDPDKEPLPPDDPAAHEFMHSVNGIKGYKNWHKLGRALAIENPYWLEPYDIEVPSGDPVVGHSEVKLLKVALPELIDLTYIHNREYQTNLEDLYLSALALTQQRWNLGVRYLGVTGAQPGSSLRAPLSKDGSPGIWSQNFGVSQNLAAGGQVAVEIANTVTWAFGQHGTNPAPTIGYSVTQPLLFRAGRKIALEPLTQAERTVLYNARSLARFRQTLFVSVSASYLSLLNQRQVILNNMNNIRQLEVQYKKQQALDSWLPGTVRERLDILPDGFEKPDDLIPDDLKGHFSYDGQWLKWEGILTPEDQARLRSLSNDETYQSAIQDLISQKTQDATGLSSYQLLNQLKTAQAGLANNRRVLADSQDALKILLGLPPNIQLVIDEQGLTPFTLISNELIDLELRLREIQKELGRELFPDVGGGPAESMPDFATLKQYLSGLRMLRDELGTSGIETVRKDFVPVQELLEFTKDDWTASQPGKRFFRNEVERTRLAENLEEDQSNFDLAESFFVTASDQLDALQQLIDVPSIDEILPSLDSDASGTIELSELPDSWRSLPRLGTNTAAETYTIPSLLSEIRDASGILREVYFLRLTQQLEVLQAGLRVEAIKLNRFSLDESHEFPNIEEVVNLGLEYRHDLMNSRAQVMDSRRQVEIAANQLESTLDLSFQGREGIGRNNGGPVNSASVSFTTPLGQVDNRNNYRTTLITYQRQRRAYMLFEDQIKLNIRQSWRQIQVQEYRMEIDRANVRIAAKQYDNAALQASAGAQQNALSLLQALRTVLDAQNTLVGDWITYEQNRLNIFRDMGIMQLDPRGVWDDSYYLQMKSLRGDAEPVPPANAPGAVPPILQPQN